MESVRVRVTGRVQGVGFRAFIARRAEELRIDGEVWNRSDGSVEAILQARDRAVLDSFLKEIRQGPGRVESVHADLVQIDEPYRGFSISPSRP